MESVPAHGWGWNWVSFKIPFNPNYSVIFEGEGRAHTGGAGLRSPGSTHMRGLTLGSAALVELISPHTSV